MIDIEYLLLLQQFRENINDALTPFMEMISLFAVTYLIMIPIFVYWIVDKKKGLYTLVSYYLCCGFNAMLKLTVCAYRPWIRDARIMPAGDAITTATGYSFPSGHTAMAGPMYGGLAVGAWKKLRWLSFILIVLILITGFSRNYLGVHTPQDVIVGTLETIFWLLLTAKLFVYLEKHPEKENYFLIASFLVGWLGILYITFKAYPMDYMDGKLLVDPNKMMNDGYGDIGLLAAFPVARYIEKTWIKCRATGFKGAGFIAAILGLVPLFFMIRGMKAPLDALLGSHWGHFLNNFILVLYSVALWPLVIKLADKYIGRRTDPGIDLNSEDPGTVSGGNENS